MEKIEGIEVHNHKDSSRILSIQLDDEIVKKLIFPFNKFDLETLNSRHVAPPCRRASSYEVWPHPLSGLFGLAV